MSERVENLISSFIEVTLPHDENFLLVKETLTRIGISSKTNKLFQSCHILHKKGKFYIVHFKELFALDGKAPALDEADVARRNTIAKLLHDWELCDIVGAELIQDEDGEYVQWPSTMKTFCPLNKIKIIPFSEKSNWELVTKYSIGKKKY